jgi:transposase
MAIVGIDVSKKKIDVHVLLEDKKSNYKIFENNKKGFKELIGWLTVIKVKEAHICLEATGCYGEAISLFMHEQGYKVSVINPARIKAYARSEGCRVKTDKVDSGVIARFCKAQCPPAWTPPSLSERKLKDLYRCRQSLLEDKIRVINRLENLMRDEVCLKIWKDLLASIEIQLKEVNVQLKELLESNKVFVNQVNLLKTIPGVSDKTAIAVLSELPNIKGFKNAKEVAAFAGLTPCERQSGSSLRGKGRLSKAGNSQLRKALYMPTIVAKRYNPILKEFCKRLSLKGKPTMVVLAAGMRKLLHIIFGVLKTEKPFTFYEKEA